jgi:nitroimidazol reductase NimA-like FMN-containing flavoprotein (pyridoxamine 5'-phosphate oxidase superfamily)
MGNQRSAIRLGEDEIRLYLETQKTLIMGTRNHDGCPHLVPMWYVMIDGRPHMHTYKRSQKVINVGRDPRGSILVEDGTAYDELRGVFVRGRFEVLDDQELCYRIGILSAKKYNGADEEQAGDAIRYAVRKRVALVFHPEKYSSWDHRKIGGNIYGGAG